MVRRRLDHGPLWENGKSEARTAMIDVASREKLIWYSSLAGNIESLEFDPSDHLFHKLLGEISTEEHEAGRGMLSVVVVHKDGDQIPGKGFFQLAKELGHDIENQEEFWVDELRKVYRVHAKKEESQS